MQTKFFKDNFLVTFKTTKESETLEGCNILFLEDCAGRAESFNFLFFEVAPHATVAWFITLRKMLPLIRYLLRYPELLPHASPYVAREMSLAVSGALANRGLTTVRLT